MRASIRVAGDGMVDRKDMILKHFQLNVVSACVMLRVTQVAQVDVRRMLTCRAVVCNLTC